MPQKRIPFGEAKANEILNGYVEYVNRGYDVSETRFVDIVGIMKEYRDAMGISSKFSDCLDGYPKQDAQRN